MTSLKKSAVISYILGMIFFFSLPLIFTYSQVDYYAAEDLLFSFQYWLFIFYFLCVYFLLTLFIVPWLYEKRNYAGLVIAMIALFISAMYVRPFDRLMHRKAERFQERIMRDMPPPGNNQSPAPKRGFSQQQRPPQPRGNKKFSPPFDVVSIFLLIMVILIVISSESVKRWRLTEKRAIQAEAEKANAELSFLKAQINPHFLFNTLNNIYSLAVTKNDNAADAVMKLSSIMRYVTDDVHEILVPLQSEIDCITNYISLQKLRLGENFPIEFSTNGNIAAKKIPPLVLMTFVENAFKHGISNHEKTNTVIKITADEKQVYFFEQNIIFSKPVNVERTGIGIENTKKRLQALYPGKHNLNITRTDKLYTVELTLYS